jgi:hypothetical protein
MVHNYNAEICSLLGFKYVRTSCTCKNYYIKQTGNQTTIIIRRERCKSGQPSVRCNWEMLLLGYGETRKVSGEQSFIELSNQVTSWEIEIN